MDKLISAHPAVAWLVFAAAIVTALGVLWRSVGRPVLRTAKKASNFIDDVVGEPARPGVPARPGLMDRVQAVEKRLTAIEHELHPNSGTSLRDQVDAIRDAVAGDTPG
ncbi:MAG TPA: hypothetical protein VFV67_34110 [Actinophytocola sp.]|uniref:hypothetical protein n=1 Tax=Actinophytocola sp. TaxID=1872138 RepID=UPI002DB8E175|nr:hypothetical protein [Actinophytocola sp.]HEU5475703.1 hypothetical protein [Actinophytocola sp.]